MPYKDPVVLKAYKARWWKRFCEENPDYHRNQMRAWKLRRRGPGTRLVRPSSFATPQEELEYLIKEQAKDDKTIRIKHDSGLDARADEVYTKEDYAA